MKKLTVTFFLVLLVSCNHCYGQDYFNMSFEKEALYSPAKLELKLSYKKLISSSQKYNYRISLYWEDTRIERRVIPPDNLTTIIKFNLPSIKIRTDITCRVELFLDKKFIEAEEKIFSLFPQRLHFSGLKNSLIWVIDSSRRLQEKLGEIDVAFWDADFKLVKDFTKPDLVLIAGDDVNTYIGMIPNFIMDNHKTIVTFFLSDYVMNDLNIKESFTLAETDKMFINGLSKLDILNLAEKYNLSFKNTAENCKQVEDCLLDSFKVYKSPKEDVIIFCYLPLNQEDPRLDIILLNLFEYFCDITQKL